MKPKTLFSAASVLCVCLALALPQTILAQSETGRDPGSSPGSPVPPTGERGPTTDTGSRSDIQDQVIADDLIVDGSACVGFDCVNGESFGFDTIRLKENNLRIKFQDTSTSASFPRATGRSRLMIRPMVARTSFRLTTLMAVAPRLPLKPVHRAIPVCRRWWSARSCTSIPVVDLHVVSGNTPTLRLEQNGSSGFAPQTWDVAGNETSFFIRDATNGSTLPFRIFPGASSQSLVIDDGDDVGIVLERILQQDYTLWITLTIIQRRLPVL